MSEVRKAEPAAEYPPEEGCYLRGNDYSPVAVVVILRWMREQTPADIENLVRVAVESGAALAGTLQTENVGLEKIICNVVSNPNIRRLIVCGPQFTEIGYECRHRRRPEMVRFNFSENRRL